MQCDLTTRAPLSAARARPALAAAEDAIAAFCARLADGLARRRRALLARGRGHGGRRRRARRRGRRAALHAAAVAVAAYVLRDATELLDVDDLRGATEPGEASERERRGAVSGKRGSAGRRGRGWRGRTHKPVRRVRGRAELLNLNDVAVEVEVQRVKARGVASAEAALNKALADAALSRVLAPIAGTILRIYARPGDQVGSDGLMEIADLTAIDVVADVYETDLPRLTLGMAAEVIVPGETRRFPATLREIGLTIRRAAQANTDPVAAVDARSVEVRLTLGEEGRALLARRANMQVQVALRPPAGR